MQIITNHSRKTVRCGLGEFTARRILSFYLPNILLVMQKISICLVSRLVRTNYFPFFDIFSYLWKGAYKLLFFGL